MSHCKLDVGQNSIYYLGCLCHLSNNWVMKTLNASKDQYLLGAHV